MTISTIDLTQRLDEIEKRLPTIPAKSFAFGRATVRRTNDVVVSVVSDVARRVDTVVGTSRTGANTTAGQAKSAVDRTAKAAETATKQTVGQARSAANRTAKMAETTAKQTVGQAKSAASRTAKVATTTSKQAAGQARHQGSKAGATARREVGELLDDATASVDPSASPRGIAYEDWTKSELYDRAQELDIDGRSTMSKPELITALRSAS